MEAASGMVNTIAAFIVFPAAGGVTLDMSPIYHTFNESYHYWSHEIALEIKHWKVALLYPSLHDLDGINNESYEDVGDECWGEELR